MCQIEWNCLLSALFLLLGHMTWRQVEISISKIILLCQAARASKTSFLSAEKRALFTPITHCFRFTIVQLKWTFSVHWIRKFLISETVIVCCSAKKWLTLNISNCIRPPLSSTHSFIYLLSEDILSRHCIFVYLKYFIIMSSFIWYKENEFVIVLF